MSQQTINIGSAANDNTGDPLRTAFGKANHNFNELYLGQFGCFRPEFYGTVGEGDDTAAIQAAIDAARAAGGVVKMGLRVYEVTDTLSIPDADTVGISVKGVHSLLFSGKLADSSGASINLPGNSPFIGGTTIKMKTAAKNVIEITAVGKSVNFKNLSILIGDDADSIRFQNTGHGIWMHPEGTYGGYGENGVQYFTWENLAIYGVDGNHYCIHMCNSLYGGELKNLFLVGGGALEFENDSTSYCGNMTVIGGWFWMVCAGTSHGIYLKNTSFGGTGTGTDHVAFLNVQVLPQPCPVVGVTGPGYGEDTQRLIKIDDGAQFISAEQCSFESVGFNCFVDLPDYIPGLVWKCVSTTGSTNQWTREQFANGDVGGASPMVLNCPISFGKGYQGKPSRRMFRLLDWPVNPYVDNSAYSIGFGLDDTGRRFSTHVQHGDALGAHEWGALEVDGTTFHEWMLLTETSLDVPAINGLTVTDSTGTLTVDNGKTLRAKADITLGDDIVILASEFTAPTNSTTLTSVTGMSRSLAAGTWEIKWKGAFDDADETPGHKASLDFGGVTCDHFTTGIFGTTDNAPTGKFPWNTTSTRADGLAVDGPGNQYSGFDFTTIVVIPSTATVSLQVAQKTSSSSATKLHNGYLVFRRLA